MALPHGIEVLLKKASVDPGFRELLLAERSAAAGKIGLDLTPAEAAMIDSIPAAQLEASIDATKVEPSKAHIFKGTAAALMVAACAGFLLFTPTASGIRAPLPSGSRPAATMPYEEGPASRAAEANDPRAGRGRENVQGT